MRIQQIYHNEAEFITNYETNAIMIISKQCDKRQINVSSAREI